MSIIEALYFAVGIVAVIAVVWPSGSRSNVNPPPTYPRPKAPRAPPPLDYTHPIHIPDEWMTWEGKDRGEPKPPIIWVDKP